jgi:hypothetical protein
MMHRHLVAVRIAPCVAAALVAASCAERAPARSVVEEWGMFADSGSAEPNIAAAPDGRVYLSWLQRFPDSTQALLVSRIDGRRVTPPDTVVRSPRLVANWADFPSLLAGRNGIVTAHWLERRGGGKYAYEIRVARSENEGRSWTSPVAPHRDTVIAERGFATMYATGTADSLGIVWLDARNSTGGEGTGAMMLAHTLLAADGTRGAETPLDQRTCDCCQTAIARASTGLVVAYRDRSPDEIRDIYTVRRSPGGAWTEPTRVHADDWHIAACPVNGPQLAAQDSTVAIAWFTAARDTARVYVAFSHDGGATWAAPVRVDDGNPAGRVDIELDERGTALVSWIERTGGDAAEIRVRPLRSGGPRGAAVTVATSSATRASGFPRMARVPGGVMIVWTEPAAAGRGASRVRLARVTNVPAR